jgi:hypothetical protein
MAIVTIAIPSFFFGQTYQIRQVQKMGTIKIQKVKKTNTNPKQWVVDGGSSTVEVKKS